MTIGSLSEQMSVSPPLSSPALCLILRLSSTASTDCGVLDGESLMNLSGGFLVVSLSSIY